MRQVLPETVALSLGGNLGDTAAIFSRALGALARRGLTIDAASSLYRNAPVDCAPGTPDFVNAAVVGRWSGPPETLLRATREQEVLAGRPADHAPYASRPLDIDLVLFGERVIEQPGLHVPHPRASDRLFVLVPLAEINPDLPFPGAGTVRDALARHDASAVTRFLLGKSPVSLIICRDCQTL